MSVSPRCPPPLINDGDKCYLNAIMQALGSCEKMIEDLLKMSHKYSSPKLIAFVNLLEAMNSHEAQTQYDDYMQKYGWNRSGQQDSYEIMITLLNSIYNEVKKEASNGKDKKRFLDTWKSEVLPCRINMTMQIKCSCDLTKKTKINDFALHLPLFNYNASIDRIYDINDMLEAVYNEEPISGGCQRCGKESVLCLDIDEDPPRTLCFHVQANKHNQQTGDFTKLKYRLNYSFNIKVKSKMYTLVSFVEHFGDISFGHYITYRRFKGRWFIVNDTFVKELDNKANPYEYSYSPYILFFEITN